MTFAFGARSIANMKGVHPVLVDVAHAAIVISSVDFGVQEPQVRTIADQKKKVASGASQTLKSKHIEATDFSGRTRDLYGHALDLVPWVDGKWSWDWDHIWPIAEAMGQAAIAKGVGQLVCWGGVWDRWIGDYAGDAAAMEKAEQAYLARHAGRDFPDGPHFQIYRQG